MFVLIALKLQLMKGSGKKSCCLTFDKNEN